MQGDAAGTGGRVIAGRYRLIGLMDDGPMAQVWHGWDERAGSAVALKWVRQPLADDPFVVEALTAAQTWAARASHPHIARPLGVARDGAALVVAREYVPGMHLRGWLRQQSGPPTLDALVHLLDPAGAALAAAHAAGVVHAHLTMENLLVAADGRAVVTDFGVRQAMLSLLAIHGVPLGDGATVSPEQWRGEPFTPQTDVYALAAILYEALTGTPPFTGNAAPPAIPLAERVMWEHLHAAPPPLRARVPALSPAAEAAILHALAKDPGARPASVPAFLGQLAAIAGASAPTAALTAPPMPPAPPPGVPVGAGTTVPLAYPPPAPSPALPPPMPTQPLPAAAAPPPKRGRAWLAIPILALLLLGVAALLALFRPWQASATATATPGVVAASTGVTASAPATATVAATPTPAPAATPTALPANTAAATAPPSPPPTAVPATAPAPTLPVQPTATAGGIIAPLLPTATAVPPTVPPPTANPRAVAANMNDPSQWNVQVVELSSRTLANGAYTVRVRKQPDGRGLLSWGDWNPKNTTLAPQFIAEVEMQLTGDPKAASGGMLFAFNSVPETAQQQFVVFLVRADGQFQVLEQRPGTGVPLVDWTPSPAIKTGANATNTLHVEVREGRIICAVNGQQVASVPLPATLGAYKGFALAARVLTESAQPEASAVFRDLRYAPVG